MRVKVRAPGNAERMRMHELQRVFATDDGETAWTQDMHALFGANAFDEAEALLAEALTALDTELAWTCLELPREAVVLSGWEEMGEAIAMHEGEPVTGVTIAIANESDRAFEKGQVAPALCAPRHLHRRGLRTSPQRSIGNCSTNVTPKRPPGRAGGGYRDPHGHRRARRSQHPARRITSSAISFATATRQCRAASLRRIRARLLVACASLASGGRDRMRDARVCRAPIPVVAGMVDMRPEVVAIHDSGNGPQLAGAVPRADESVRA